MSKNNNIHKMINLKLFNKIMFKILYNNSNYFTRYNMNRILTLLMIQHNKFSKNKLNKIVQYN